MGYPTRVFERIRAPAQATSSPRWDGRLSSWFTCPGAGGSSADASRACAGDELTAMGRACVAVVHLSRSRWFLRERARALATRPEVRQPLERDPFRRVARREPRRGSSNEYLVSRFVFPSSACACVGDERLSSWFTCPGAGGSSVDAREHSRPAPKCDSFSNAIRDSPVPEQVVPPRTRASTRDPPRSATASRTRP